MKLEVRSQPTPNPSGGGEVRSCFCNGNFEQLSKNISPSKSGLRDPMILLSSVEPPYQDFGSKVCLAYH
ncbi:MAG: hypothetical protein QNJ68_03295 [Microcoleaceae cyanobacterium MO_207.B10]|nr:hypothetical protein [Microcoleaceae cyanobacterium MO_207.B10]